MVSHHYWMSLIHGLNNFEQMFGRQGVDFLLTKLPGKKRLQNEETEFVPLYESCYDNKKKIVLYTIHAIYGSAYEAKRRLETIPALPDDEWSFDNSDLDTIFSKQTQFDSFRKIIDEEDVTLYNDRALRYLKPLQLTPADDMIFYSLRSAVFSQYNITGQWESIMGRGWRIVEEIVREHIYKVRADYTVSTGTYDILRLGKLNREIYLDLRNETPSHVVPYLIWKALIHESTKRAIVFVSSNNPHANECALNVICENMCSFAGFSIVSSNDPWAGCVTCCSYKEASKAIKDIPYFDVPNILKYGD